MRIVITGYAGFIGSNLTRMLLSDENEILGIDALTYAARPEYVRSASRILSTPFTEAHCDIRDSERLMGLIKSFNPDEVYHLAAESHVCRSIEGPRDFATTNFMGTFNLLEVLRKTSFKGRLVHVSTDEAFGELDFNDDPFIEKTAIDPRSPYSASKAASDLMVKAYAHTYGLDAVITRCTNNYGPNQHEEKLIPKAIRSFLAGDRITLYGNGTHVRDWVWVLDHCGALITAMEFGKKGELYCVGSGLELSNKEVVSRVMNAVERVTNKRMKLNIVYTNDRPTDDKRYAVDNEKIKRLGWACDSHLFYFDKRLDETVRWYMENTKCAKS